MPVYDKVETGDWRDARSPKDPQRDAFIKGAFNFVTGLDEVQDLVTTVPRTITEAGEALEDQRYWDFVKGLAGLGVHGAALVPTISKAKKVYRKAKKMAGDSSDFFKGIMNPDYVYTGPDLSAARRMGKLRRDIDKGNIRSRTTRKLKQFAHDRAGDDVRRKIEKLKARIGKRGPHTTENF